MATGVNVKMGVSGLSDFKRSMGDAEASVKTLTAALKLNESQLQMNGNEELVLKNKVELLKEQIKAQAEVVKQAENALKALKDSGVSEASKKFQDMQGKVYTAATKLMDMKANLQEVENGAKGAAGQTENLNTNVEKISKSEAWQNFADGVGKVTSKLEQGARAAINFGKRILGSFKDSAQWADDLKTLSDETGYSVDQLQRMDKVAHRVEADAETIAGAMNRMKKAATTKGGVGAIEGILGLSLDAKNAEDLFWEVGEALLNLGDEFDKEEAATKIFGRSWHEMIPLFKTGRDAYEKMLEEQTVLTDEQVDSLAKGDDAIKEMENEIQQLKNQFWSDNAENITKLLQWLIDNKDSVVTALTVIGGGFAALKMAEFAASLGQAMDGFKKLGLLGGAKGGAEKAVEQAVEKAVEGGGSAAAGGGFLGKILGIAKGAAVPAGVVAAAVTPAILAQNDTYAKSSAEKERRLQAAGTSESMEAAWLRQAAEALEIGWGQNQDFGGIERMLMGMNSRSDLEKAKLANMLNGQYTSSGYNTWEELRRMWAGDESMDLGRMVSLMESVTEAYERLVTTQEETNKQSANALTSEDISNFNGIPAQMTQAVRAGMSGVSIVIGADAVAAISRQVSRNIGRGVHALLD